jgi:hypothetical protein
VISSPLGRGGTYETWARACGSRAAAPGELSSKIGRGPRCHEQSAPVSLGRSARCARTLDRDCPPAARRRTCRMADIAKLKSSTWSPGPQQSPDRRILCSVSDGGTHIANIYLKTGTAAWMRQPL